VRRPACGLAQEAAQIARRFLDEQTALDLETRR
jgi:hypothetical protein